MSLITTFLFALIPLLGIAWVVINGLIFTVDGLFMSLILLTISGICGTMGLFEIFRGRSGASAKPGSRGSGGSSSSGLVQRGKVQSVEFFESSVGQPNKSIVTLTGPNATLVFEGDLRNALPLGQKVEVTMRKEIGYNVLLNVN
ncbi:MAG TPA: hypothetical protein VGA01_09205 [Candidatus Binatia bacterium]